MKSVGTGADEINNAVKTLRRMLEDDTLPLRDGTLGVPENDISSAGFETLDYELKTELRYRNGS